MSMSRFGAMAALATAGALAFAGCGSSNDKSSSSGSASSSGNKPASAKKKTVCAIMPDADSSSRWVHNDQPTLTKQFEAAGFKILIQNAENDTQKYATIAQQELTSGCNLMVLTDLNGAGIQVTQQAHNQGIPVIAYDRPIKGSDYYVSFDNFHVGELEGQMIVDGLKAEGKDPKTAKVVYDGGDPTDGNAAQFYGGANKVMKAAGIKPAFKTPGTWDQAKSQTYFEQAYTALHGNVDAVWAANDTNAGSAITVLDKNGKKVPVSGQDATPPGLQNVLLGKQFGTVYKPYQLEAAATVKLGKALLAGQKPTVSKKAPDGTPFIAEKPTVVTSKNMQQVFTDGNAKVSDVCTGKVKALCDKAGIQ
jgi:D-xylose transport system substrate-binding protein